MTQLAVIKTGGKQYLVSPGDKIKIDPPASKAGKTKSEKTDNKEIVFEEVLLLQKGNKVEIGNPLVKGVKVLGKILEQGKRKKQIIFKYKPKTRYKVKKGHRQPYMEIEITKIVTG